jgi:hypothetical protein
LVHHIVGLKLKGILPEFLVISAALFDGMKFRAIGAVDDLPCRLRAQAMTTKRPAILRLWPMEI